MTFKLLDDAGSFRAVNVAVGAHIAPPHSQVSTLWQSVILMAHNPLFEILPTESIIRDHQEAYYKAIQMQASVPFL